MRPTLLAVLLLVTMPLAAQVSQAVGGEPLYRIIIPSTQSQLLRMAMERKGFDVSCMGRQNGYVEAIVSRGEHTQLVRAGLQPLIVETAQPLSQKLAGQGSALLGNYRDLATINAELAAVQTSHGSIAMVVDAAAVYGPGATYEGRPINVMKISDNVTQDEDEPNVLIVSCHHARELVTPELALDAIARLTNGYGTDPAITALVDNNEIWIAPVWNPDGYNYVFTTNNLWRKNRKPFPGGTGVDLNRNYDLNWQGLCGASTNPNSETYRGPSVASEEETQTMQAFGRNRRFAKVLDFHSFGQEVLQSYNCASMPAVIESYIDGQAVTLANVVGFGVRNPSADGENYEWAIKELTSYSFLTETATEFQPAYATAIAEVNAVWPATLAFLQKSIPVKGHVTDAVSGAPLDADIELLGVAWTQGETRRSEPTFGRYHLFLPAGSRQIRFSKPGYTPQTLTVNVPASGTTTLNVALQPGLTFSLTTTGGGTGDINMSLTNIPAAAFVGLTLLSFDVSHPVGTGNIFGIQADPLTFIVITSAPSPTNPLHWTVPLIPGLYPASPFVLGPGGLPFAAGTSLDGQAAVFGPGYSPVLATSETVRITF